MMFIRRALRRLGYDFGRYRPVDPLAGFPDLDPAEHEIICRVQPFTMTSPERLAAMIASIKFVVRHQIPGDIVECGVWRGGSTMVAALALRALGDDQRTLRLYDTFEGMSAPTARDRSHDGAAATRLLERDPRGTGIWCYASLEDVRANLFSTGYPTDRIAFVQGKVEDTIPRSLPECIAVLRLDTDWYESTRHELQHLYPRLSPHGLLIIDDYGHWQGARQAVDEYVASLPYPLFLHRIDYTGRIAVKPSTVS